MSQHPADAVNPVGVHHVRLSVTDIARSKAFYTTLLGTEPAMDESEHVDEPGVRDDPAKLFGGCAFAVGDQIFGLRPVADAGGTFDPTRVGLDHVSLQVASRTDLDKAVERLDADGIPHGEITDIGPMTILSLQDPDDINLELAFPTG